MADARGGVLVAVLLSACGLPERSDFLVGRSCFPDVPTGCDSAQACLPHLYEPSGRFSDFRCRDAESFRPTGAGAAPVAFCAPNEGWLCPGDLTCGAGRIWADSGLRQLICKPASDGFGPPLDAGPEGG